MASASEELDAIDRMHDEAPEEAASRLRALDWAALPADRAPLAAFLLNHVLGEKLGGWGEAAGRIDRLRKQVVGAPLAVTLHAAVADGLAGRSDSEARGALEAASSPQMAACAIELRRLGFAEAQTDALGFAATLGELAQRAAALATGTALDPQLAAGLNNATSRLLDLAPEAGDALIREALQTGAAEALRFWQAAGSWVQHERALYLVALVANRVGAPSEARAAAEQALALIAAHGREEVDRAFLLLQLAGAAAHLGDAAAVRAARSEAHAIRASFTEASLSEWFAAEEAKLFGATKPG